MRVMRSSVLMVACLFALMMSCIDRPEVDTQKQMQLDLETIDNYIAANGLNAIKDKNNIRYVITELGKGFSPRTDQVIKASYVGKYLDGTTFDEDDAEGELGGYILGWQFALTLWPEGTKGKLFVPSPLGYGDKQVKTILPNSILVYDIDFKKIEISNAERAQFTADTTAIDKYLADNTIVAETDTTGVRYVITEPGAGAKPSLFSKVKFNYKGKSMATGIQFYEGVAQPNETFDSRVMDFINGLKVGLMKLAVGGKITIYVPSGLAFGPNQNPSSGLSANSNLIYEVELVEIVQQ